MAAVIQVKRGSASSWTSANTVLAAGEIGFETDTKKMKVGAETIDVKHQTAMDIMRLHSKLNDENKKLMQKHITDPLKFRRIAKMASSVK